MSLRWFWYGLGTAWIILALILGVFTPRVPERRRPHAAEEESHRLGKTPPTTVSKLSGLNYMGRYRPRAIASLDDLPSEIRYAVTSHLEDRLGETIYAQLRLIAGQIVDLEELRQVEGGPGHRRWEVPAFQLVFELRMPKLGIESCQTSIELRGDGTIIRELDLPNFRADLGKTHFVPFGEAVKTAVANGFRPEIWDAELQYDVRKDILVYRLIDLAEGSGELIFQGDFRVNAHTGLVEKD